MSLKLPKPVLYALVIHAGLFVSVVTGVLPRSIVPFWTLALVVWAAVVPPAVSVPFFATAIPLFIAIPLTTDFDNFNMWRIVALVIFLRWFLSTWSWRSLWDESKRYITAPLRSPMATALITLGLLAVLSVFTASDRQAWALRLIFFANAALVPIVAYAVTKKDPVLRRTTIIAIAWGTITVVTVGFIQLISTYILDIYAFMRVWGEGIQLRQFGALWSQIAVHMGNTWFAYYGPQLSLRMFSLFPDSHSFPVFVILAMASLFAVGFHPTMTLRTRGMLTVVWIPLAFLAVILSGTRGIWAASVGLPLVALVVLWRMRRTRVPVERRQAWRYLSSWLSVFFLLFALAWPIFVSPQFLLSGGDRGLLIGRFKSIIDFGETSNRARLQIWSATVASIARHPLLGVGLGNFPVVLGQDVILAKAGSSAHNIWLHVMAELGVIAIIPFTAVFVLAIRSAYRRFVRTDDGTEAWYAGWLLFAVPWIAAYLLTDAALFDERALLMFGLSIALLTAMDDTP